MVVQPIVKKHQRNWDYFEILTRWNSSTLGVVTPLEFIEAAEQSGLIVEFGERILELACIAKQELEQGIDQKIRLSINCSADELTHSNRYLEHLLKTIKAYGFQADEFTIELTETVLLSKAAEVCSILTILRELGLKLPWMILEQVIRALTTFTVIRLIASRLMLHLCVTYLPTKPLRVSCG